MKTARQERIASIEKSQKKTGQLLESAHTLYEKVKAVRPLFLKIIRAYDDIKHDWEYNEFCQVIYKKSCELLQDVKDRERGIELKVKEQNYVNSFKKNLKKIKKMCEDTTVSYYSLLPDRIPIDVRTHCVQFISQATVN
jgi:hypothetical protein